MTDVAVIGVGVMGSAIAGRLCAERLRLHLFDPASPHLATLAAQGARVAPSAAAAAASARFVILSLNSASVVEQAVFGADGVATRIAPDAVLIDMSSIDAGRTAALAARLRTETGAGWVDAPLSGGAPAAVSGTLTLMVGGDEDDVVRARTVLDLLAANMTHFGPPGAGQTVKLVNQILCAANFLAVAEAVRFAEAHGVDASRIPAALAGGRADSRILQEYMAKMAQRDFTPTGRIDNMLKDLETAQGAAQAQRLALPVTSLIADLHRMLVAGGLGSADSAEYVRLFDLAQPQA